MKVKKSIMHLNLIIGSLFILRASCTISKNDNEASRSGRTNKDSFYKTNKLPFLDFKNDHLNIFKPYFTLYSKIYRPFQEFDSNKKYRISKDLEDNLSDDRIIGKHKRKWPKYLIGRSKKRVKEEKNKKKFKIEETREFYIIGNSKNKRVTKEIIIPNRGIIFQKTVEPSYRRKTYIIITGLIGGVALILLISCIVFILNEVGMNPVYIKNKMSTPADYNIVNISSSDYELDEHPKETMDKSQYVEVPLESELTVRHNTDIEFVPKVSVLPENIRTPENEEQRNQISSMEIVPPQLVKEKHEELMLNKRDDEIVVSIPEKRINEEIYYYSEETSTPDPLKELLAEEVISGVPLEISEPHDEEMSRTEELSVHNHDYKEQLFLNFRNEIANRIDKDVKCRKREQNEKKYIFEVRTKRISKKHKPKLRNKEPKLNYEYSETDTSVRSCSLSDLLPSFVTPKPESDLKLNKRLETVPKKETRVIEGFILNEVKKDKNIYAHENKMIYETNKQSRYVQTIPEKLSIRSKEWMRSHPPGGNQEEDFKSVLSNRRNNVHESLNLSRIRECPQPEPKTYDKDERAFLNKYDEKSRRKPFVSTDPPFLKVGSDKCVLMARQRREQKSENKCPIFYHDKSKVRK
ncbi:uncharacterized protein LOC111627727 [Centruroides sculpturatus]|uniref:uncharacterized protein LOC111627727 n=1 Tax=Centruroides sculpturatus TaxID=218467 RepID=UPI000C6D013D|nr:uncharacterized protein LOC111627727 [Centruroides sculpturatus]